ncbi:hypothetical protein KF840_07965 [bacterium]|nr:hypothetical protein [bacterium]
MAVETAPPVAAPGRQTVVIIVGAGRSGTSAITRGVQALGVELGDHLRPPGGKNPTGFFEDQDLLAINKRLKRLLRVRGDSVRLIDDAEWRAPAVRALQQHAIATVRRRFGAHALWGYKYARTLRLFPFWQPVFAALALDTRFVVALRNPLSVARSRAALDPQRGTQEQSDLEWLVNVVPYFRDLRGRPLVVVDYDLVLAEPAAQLRRMGSTLELPPAAERDAAIDAYAAGFLRPGMRHSVYADRDLDGRVNPLTADAYRWLRRLATDASTPADERMWSEWEDIERRLAALAPVLRHVDRIQAALRRAQWNPFGPLQAAAQAWRRYRRG